MDNKTKISELKEKYKKFCEARDWDQFHNAKDLAVAISVEAAELLSEFRFKSDKESDNLFNDTKKRHKIEAEVADIFTLLLRFCEKNNIDLSEAFEKKLKKTHEKYPVEEFKGSNKKYNEL